MERTLTGESESKSINREELIREMKKVLSEGDPIALGVPYLKEDVERNRKHLGIESLNPKNVSSIQVGMYDEPSFLLLMPIDEKSNVKKLHVKVGGKHSLMKTSIPEFEPIEKIIHEQEGLLASRIIFSGSGREFIIEVSKESAQKLLEEVADLTEAAAAMDDWLKS